MTYSFRLEQADPRSSLLVTQSDTTGDPLGASRVTLLGNILQVPLPEVADARELYLDVHAGAHGHRGDQVLDLTEANVEQTIAAPLSWCPHPSATSCLHVRGSSMSPLVNDGDTVAVDSSSTDISELNGKIVIAWNRKTGLSVSRFLLLNGMQLLESENRNFRPIQLDKDRDWRIIGKVLWWIRRSP